MMFQKHFTNLLALLALFCVVMIRVMTSDTNIQPDSPRYIHMGLNLAEYGTLSGASYSPNIRPEPGLGMGGPLTAFEIALAAKLHRPTHDSLVCIVTASKEKPCMINISALKVIYAVEIFIFHLALLAIAYLLFQNQTKAWLAVGISLAFKETSIYADSILSEPAYMMFASVFLLLWLYVWRYPEKLKFWFLCGAALGLTALVKPAWNALIPALIIVSFLLLLRNGRALTNVVLPPLLFGAGAFVVLSVLLIRNVVQLDLWGLSDPSYLAASMAHRFAFNAMSWGEWAMGWVYYLPLSGAGRLFGYEVLEPLGWGSQSYYAFGRDVLNNQAEIQGGVGGAIPFLLHNHFFNTPVKAVAVTLLLLWRGIFVGHVIGMFAVPLTGLFLYTAKAEKRRIFFTLCIPPVIMAVVHALVSVSLYRYNIPLIIPYAVAMAHFGCVISLWGIGKMPGHIRERLERLYLRCG